MNQLRESQQYIKDWQTYLKLILTTFFWGGTFVAAKVAMSEGPPLSVAGLRFVVASLVLFALIVLWEQRRKKGAFPIPRGLEEWKGLFLLGFTGIFCYNIAFFFGLSYTTAANGSLIVALNPIVTALISAFVLGEKILPQQVIGFACAFSGVLIVISKGSLELLASMQFNRGDLILMGAPISWALYSILGKWVMANAKFTPLVSTAYACLFGALLLLPGAYIMEWSQGSGVHFSWKGLLALLQLSLLGTVLGFVWWYQGVTKMGVSRSSLFINLVPMFGVLLAAVILGEKLTWTQAWGFCLVVSGVYIGTALNTSFSKRLMFGKEM